MEPAPGWRGRRRRRRVASWQPATFTTLALSMVSGASGQSSGWGTRSSYDDASLGQHVCDGHEVEFSACPAQPACHLCQPLDCVFSKWSEWFVAQDCTGLRFRHRGIEIPNNKCGLPCYGSKIESQPWVRSECRIQVQDCILSVWGQWSECKDELGQSVRSRHVDRPPSNLGAPCRGSTSETRPCGGPASQPCVLDEWHDWTTCSVSCGEGRHTRMRRIQSEGQLNGQSCSDSLLETESCKVRECPSRDCLLDLWSDWSTCGILTAQRTRHRRILQSPEGEGMECKGALVETKGCMRDGTQDCIVSEWTSWTVCDKTCRGGQKLRHRKLLHPNAHGGSCHLLSLAQVTACATQPCSRDTLDCTLSAWSEWGECSSKTGVGIAIRHRHVEQSASIEGAGCLDDLREMRACSMGPARVVHCAWGDWAPWSACTCSCGGGSKRRNRAIEMAPLNGGMGCDPRHKEVIAPCNTQTCETGCEDGKWGNWMDWNHCSATCGAGFRSRRRSVDVLPNHCGAMPDGSSEEFQLCKNNQPCQKDSDCVLSVWGEWSHCSCSCAGIRERNRHIQSYATGRGRTCDGVSLKTIEACNPRVGEEAPEKCGHKPPQDCVVNEWQPWSRCSASCDGGQQTRKRILVRPPARGGRPCPARLTITRGCSTHPCHTPVAKNCLWGPWSDWGDCSHCGGQRWRHRNIIQMASHGGRICEDASAKEVSTCHSTCHEARYCTWASWSSAQCSDQCGFATNMRDRALQLVSSSGSYLFKGDQHSNCFGTQLTVEQCPMPRDCEARCVPRHCEFGAWTEWAEPSCVGLCERQRVIAQMNNECGTPCNGPMLETKHCHSSCSRATDCRMSEWSPWSHCTNLTSAVVRGQRYRHRHVIDEPKRGGVACSGDLAQSRACSHEMPEPCIFAPWKEWNACSSSCGEGTRTRERHVLRTAEDGGRQCHGSLLDVQSCLDWDSIHCGQEVKQDCIFDEWSEWDGCGFTMQRERSRMVRQVARLGGAPCIGPLHETETCHGQPKDCVMADWTDWDECTQTCGSGQTHRQRQISTFPVHGGQPCPKDLTQTKGCENQEPCRAHDCQVSAWLDWGECSISCGSGHQSRSRVVVNLRDPGGAGCFFKLAEFRACDNSDCNADCKWNSWGAWSACSKSCGGGTMTRTRSILTLPSPGGRVCPTSDLKEVLPCNVGECRRQCIDGLWGEWEEWSQCSASCAGGEMFRRRDVQRMANSCGLAPIGEDKQTKFCNAEVPCMGPRDCMFVAWSEWNQCSASCNGVSQRFRKVADYGHGAGLFCMGALKEIKPCNPGERQEPPSGCVRGPPIDCTMSEWQDWDACSASCGGGVQERSRKVVQQPSNGGFGCKDPLSQVRECARSPCSHAQPVDCVLGDWHDWGMCGSCNGERKRVRKILEYPANGGLACAPSAEAEIGTCPHNCDMQTTCSWASWSEWGQCSASCGSGERQRIRRLNPITVQLDDTSDTSLRFNHVEVLRKYDALYHRTQSLQTGHAQEIALAFATGCCSLAVLGFLTRGLRHQLAGRHDGLQRPSTGEEDHYSSDDAEAPLVSRAAD